MTTDRRLFLQSSLAGAAGLGVASLSTAADPSEKPLAGAKKTKFAANIEMWWNKQKLPVLQRLEEAAKLGFTGVEFWPWRNKDINAMADTCAKLNITVVQFTAWGFSPGLNDPAHHNKFVEEIGASCETAKKLKCKMMCVVGGNDIKGMSQEQMHENIITGLKKAAPIVEKADLTLIIEPMNIRVDHKGHCLYGSAPAVKILKAVGSKHVKLLYDAYHMHITEGDLCGHLKEYYDWIGYVQLADHPGRTEPGTGEIHYPRVLKELHSLGYRDYVGVECRPLTTELAGAQALAKADQW